MSQHTFSKNVYVFFWSFGAPRKLLLICRARAIMFCVSCVLNAARIVSVCNFSCPSICWCSAASVPCPAPPVCLKIFWTSGTSATLAFCSLENMGCANNCWGSTKYCWPSWCAIDAPVFDWIPVSVIVSGPSNVAKCFALIRLYSKCGTYRAVRPFGNSPQRVQRADFPATAVATSMGAMVRT